MAPLESEDWGGLRLFGDALERLERETAAVPFMFGRGGKAEGGIALCGMWQLSVRAILLPFQTGRYVRRRIRSKIRFFNSEHQHHKQNLTHSTARPQRYSLERSPS